MPTGKVEGMAEALLASECDCFIDCDTTTEQLTKDQQRQFPPRRYQSSKSFWHSISDFGPANQNTSWSSPFERLHPRFIRNRRNSASPSSVLESAEPWFPRSSLSESQSLCEHPLLHLLYVLGGVGNEAVTAERFRTRRLARETSTIFEKFPSLERSRRCSHAVDKQVSIGLRHCRPRALSSWLMFDCYLSASATAFTLPAVRPTQSSCSNGRMWSLIIAENQLVKTGADVEIRGYSAGVVPCVGSDNGLHLPLLYLKFLGHTENWVTVKLTLYFLVACRHQQSQLTRFPQPIIPITVIVFWAHNVLVTCAYPFPDCNILSSRFLLVGIDWKLLCT